MARESESRRRPVFWVGDRVSFTFGTSQRVGVVVEDRGPIGVGGRRLYGVRFPVRASFEGEQQYAELPATRLRVVEGLAKPSPAPILRLIAGLAERLLVEQGEIPWDQDRLEVLADELGDIDPAEAIRRAAELGAEALTNGDLQRLRFFVEELYEANFWVEPEEKAGHASHDGLWAELGRP